MSMFELTQKEKVAIITALKKQAVLYDQLHKGTNPYNVCKHGCVVVMDDGYERICGACEDGLSNIDLAYLEATNIIHAVNDQLTALQTASKALKPLMLSRHKHLGQSVRDKLEDAAYEIKQNAL